MILDDQPKMKNQGKITTSGSFVVENTPLRQAHTSLEGAYASPIKPFALC